MLHDKLGMGEALKTLHGFKSFFGIESNDDDGPDELFGEDEFVPSLNGINHQFPDGVVMPVRMRLVNGRYTPEWLLPDRLIEVPESRCMVAARSFKT